jgi:hypothetical protein
MGAVLTSLCRAAIMASSGLPHTPLLDIGMSGSRQPVDDGLVTLDQVRERTSSRGICDGHQTSMWSSRALAFLTHIRKLRDCREPLDALVEGRQFFTHTPIFLREIQAPATKLCLAAYVIFSARLPTCLHIVDRQPV